MVGKEKLRICSPPLFRYLNASRSSMVQYKNRYYLPQSCFQCFSSKCTPSSSLGPFIENVNTCAKDENWPLRVEHVANRGEGGRGVRATRDIEKGEILYACTPSALVVKEKTSTHCHHCLNIISDPAYAPYCSKTCRELAVPFGANLLERCDLSSLEKLQREENRNFPLIITRLIASLLAYITETGGGQSGMPQLELLYSMCFAKLGRTKEAEEILEEEFSLILKTFSEPGICQEDQLRSLLGDLDGYIQFLGALQVNAFEIASSKGVKASACLPGIAPFFNHSCEPSALIRCFDNEQENVIVAFQSSSDIKQNEEVFIAYCSLDGECKERRTFLHEKYGFHCQNCQS
eukprot:g5595.t1